MKGDFKNGKCLNLLVIKSIVLKDYELFYNISSYINCQKKEFKKNDLIEANELDI